MAQKILVIYTGGTIGMQEKDGFLTGGEDFLALMEQTIHANKYKTLPEFDLVNLSPAIDSACITPEHWQQLHQLIDKHYADYKGFVVLHGTDTMAYTASILSFLLGGLDKPIIFTGSQIPLIKPFSDGEANLVGAMALAANANVPEVGLFFAGKLLRGNCASKVSTTDLTAFKSHQYPPLAEINGKLIFHPQHCLPKQKHFPKSTNLTNPTISTLFLTPGICFKPFAEAIHNKQLQGLILVSYGAGNVPADNQAFLNLLKTAQDNDMVVVNKSQCYHGAINHHYAASKPLLDYHVISSGQMTLEATYTKLLYLLSEAQNTTKNHDWVRNSLTLNLRGELAI